MTIQTGFLKSTSYFSGLSPAELDSIKRLFFERTVKRGEVIALEGELASALFFIASGVVKVFKTSAEGKEQIMNLVRPGESFNDVPVFDDSSNPTTSQAMGPVVLYGLKKVDLNTIIQEHPQVSLNIIKVLADRVRQLLSLVEDLSFRHVIGRVARILLDHIEDGTSPIPRLTQHEMAAMAGTVREVVARSLRALEDEGAISLRRHRIVITDREVLRGMVEAPS
jgi:CRP/FNR family transcriptional regulator